MTTSSCRSCPVADAAAGARAACRTSVISARRCSSGRVRTELPHAPRRPPVGQMCGISTFSEYSVVAIDSAVKVGEGHSAREGMPRRLRRRHRASGRRRTSANVQPGDTVIIMGIGGIGINAVQGAAIKGAANVIAVDPVAFKREKAMELGATHAFADIAEATEFARASRTVRARTQRSSRSASRRASTSAKRSTRSARPAPLWSPASATSWRSASRSTRHAYAVPEADPGFAVRRVEPVEGHPPRMLAMYQSGILKLDELVTSTYTLDTINEGYADMHAGKNLRGVIIHNK